MKLVNLVFVVLVAVSVNVYSQEAFDAEQFAIELNEAIKEEADGIKIISVIEDQMLTGQDWVTAVTQKPQDFAVVAMDAAGKPIDIFGSSTPFESMGGGITVPGFSLPEGGSYRTVGAAGWAEAANTIAVERLPVLVPSSSIKKAVGTITNATDYIAQKLCSIISRPTKLVLNLNAGYELVFNASTGSEVEWDLEIVCNRIK